MKRQQIPNRFASRSVAQKFMVFGTAFALACLSASAMADDGNSIAGGSNTITVGGEKVTAAPKLGPNVNTDVGNARVIIPDGTSVGQGIAAGETRWFAFGAEAAKTYTVEVLDPYADLFVNFIGSVGIFNSNGTTAASEATTDCTRRSVSPSIEVSTDGVRCVIRTFIPTATTTLNKRGIYIGVGGGAAGGTFFQIRVRESTLYGRWTTNGYDFHVELQNTTTDSICVQVLRFPGTGENTLPTGVTGFLSLTIPPMGASKTVFANGSLVDGDNKGALRIHDCGSGNFVAGSLQMNTYAFNPVTNLFIPFSNSAVNGGSTSNSY